AGRRVLRDALLSAAVAACVLALAAPQVGTWMRPVQERGVDLMFVLDTSRSMLARDVPPSRLERARQQIRGLLDRLHGDRVGLVGFAGDARLVCPLTSDPASFRLFLDDVDSNTNARGGTAVGEGLELALDSFDPDVPGARVIVLLTDGDDNASDPPASEVAYRAHALGIPVHVVSFGDPAGSEIAVEDDRGNLDVVRDAAGQPVISRPNDELLEQVASIGGGAFVSAARTAFPLDEIWDKRIALMEGVTRSTAERAEGVNRFQWALMAALLLLGTRVLIPEGRAR
ncbi:MAG TPA: VWA domain-containing protein, partial [Planctomycetota bacterium]|nr:VWA domain-containing protein [Planctomycetota bacterium]